MINNYVNHLWSYQCFNTNNFNCFVVCSRKINTVQYSSESTIIEELITIDNTVLLITCYTSESPPMIVTYIIPLCLESPRSSAASIFQSNIAETSDAIGKEGTISRIANEFFGKALIAREFIADLDSIGGRSAADKGRKLVYNLYDTLNSRDDSDNVLTITCDILIKQQDSRLKKLGNKMKKELNDATSRIENIPEIQK